MAGGGGQNQMRELAIAGLGLVVRLMPQPLLPNA